MSHQIRLCQVILIVILVKETNKHCLSCRLSYALMGQGTQADGVTLNELQTIVTAFC